MSAVRIRQFLMSHFLKLLVELRVAASGIAWKGSESDGVIAMKSEDIKWAQWLRVARNFQLRIGLKDHSKETFDGFIREVCC